MLSAPLFIVPDGLYEPPRRYLVKDRAGNTLFISDLGAVNPEEDTIKWAIEEGGWLAGLVAGGYVPSDKVASRGAAGHRRLKAIVRCA